jgi:hypothetical protein
MKESPVKECEEVVLLFEETREMDASSQVTFSHQP